MVIENCPFRDIDYYTYVYILILSIIQIVPNEYKKYDIPTSQLEHNIQLYLNNKKKLEEDSTNDYQPTKSDYSDLATKKVELYELYIYNIDIYNRNKKFNRMEESFRTLLYEWYKGITSKIQNINQTLENYIDDNIVNKNEIQSFLLNLDPSLLDLDTPIEYDIYI